MFQLANPHPSGDPAAAGLTGGPAFSLGSALDHPLTGYVILPAAGAAVGALTHPLQALLHRVFHSKEEREQHPWKLRHSALVGTGIGMGQAISHHLHQLRHRKHAAWRPPVMAQLFVEPLVRAALGVKQGGPVRLGAWYVQGQDALPTDANYHRRGPGYKRRGHAAGQAQNLALLAKDAGAPALSSLPHTMHPISNGQEMIHPVLFHGQLAPQQGPKPGPQLGPTAPNFTAPQHGKATVEGVIQSNNKLAGMGDWPRRAAGRTVVSGTGGPGQFGKGKSATTDDGKTWASSLLRLGDRLKSGRFLAANVACVYFATDRGSCAAAYTARQRGLLWPRPNHSWMTLGLVRPPGLSGAQLAGDSAGPVPPGPRARRHKCGH